MYAFLCDVTVASSDEGAWHLSRLHIWYPYHSGVRDAFQWLYQLLHLHRRHLQILLRNLGNRYERGIPLSVFVIGLTEYRRLVFDHIQRQACRNFRDCNPRNAPDTKVVGPTGPMWDACWPHKLCYLGFVNHTLYIRTDRFVSGWFGDVQKHYSNCCFIKQFVHGSWITN